MILDFVVALSAPFIHYLQETEFVDHSGYYYGPSAGPLDYPPQQAATAAPLHQTAPTLRRARYYSPSYTTYPPSTMYPMPMGTVYPISNQQMEEERKAAKKRHINKRYPLLLRAALKFAQLVCGFTPVLTLQ